MKDGVKKQSEVSPVRPGGSRFDYELWNDLEMKRRVKRMSWKRVFCGPLVDLGMINMSNGGVGGTTVRATPRAFSAGCEARGGCPRWHPQRSGLREAT